MSVHHYYRICCSHYGKPVRIIDRAGKRHFGKITRVTPTHVYIQPIPRGLGGFGYGFGGFRGFRGFRGFGGFAIPFSFIAGLIVGGIFA